MTVTRFLDDALEATPLTGGTHHSGWLVAHADGSRYVVKATSGLPPDIFEAEAEGLVTLRESGAIGAPRVIDVGADHLVMEALEPMPGLADVDFWERTGRALARLHSIRSDRFGWHRDNWLGPTRQINSWTEDGYEFFTRHRILRYLAEPAAEASLDAGQRRAIERICARLPDLVPPSYPALTHGDLWHGNVLAMPDGSPALIDPAVSWNWPETDLSMLLGVVSMVPVEHAPALDRCFAAYHEIHPPQPGWRDHLQLLHLRELLCLLAAGRADFALPHVLAVIERYG